MTIPNLIYIQLKLKMKHHMIINIIRKLIGRERTVRVFSNVEAKAIMPKIK